MKTLNVYFKILQFSRYFLCCSRGVFAGPHACMYEDNKMFISFRTRTCCAYVHMGTYTVQYMYIHNQQKMDEAWTIIIYSLGKLRELTYVG